MKLLSGIFLLYVLSSCANSSLITGTSRTDSTLGRKLENQKASFSMEVYGDYRFKKLGQRSTPKMNRHIKRMISAHHSKRLFTSFTILEPFVSCEAHWYSKELPETIRLERRDWILNNSVNVNLVEKFTREDQSIRAILYTVEGVNYLEYIIPSGSGTVTVIFWSVNDGEWLKRESSSLIGSIATLN